MAGEDPSLDALPEIDDASIIAEQAQAHLPQRRARVRNDSKSVVISEPPADTEPPTIPRPDTAPPTRRRARHEPTLVIRDRRELEELRRRILDEKRRRQSWRGWVLVLIAGLVMAVSGLLAFAWARHPGPSADRRETPSATPGSPRPAPSPASGASGREAPPTVRFDELPLEHPSTGP